MTFTTIQIPSACVPAPTVDLWMTGQVPPQGFLSQEQINLDVLESTSCSHIVLNP